MTNIELQNETASESNARPRRSKSKVGDEWGTPLEIVEPIRAFFGHIDTDPASNDTAQRVVKAGRHFTKADDGLAQEWHGRVFLNPPYSRGLPDKFVDKLLQELAAGRTTAAILLVNNCADTRWFRKAARAASSVCFTHGRIKFLRPDGEKAGSPAQGQVLMYFGPDPETFEEAFGDVGLRGRLYKRKTGGRGRRRAYLLQTLAQHDANEQARL
jgi:phage N-6-adenine-methyltransferase